MRILKNAYLSYSAVIKTNRKTDFTLGYFNNHNTNTRVKKNFCMHFLLSKCEYVALYKIRFSVSSILHNYMHYELESFIILKEQLTNNTSDSLRNKGKKKMTENYPL